MRRSCGSLFNTVRIFIRHALHRGDASSTRRFVVEARDLGGTLPGIRLDDVGALLDRLEHK